MCYNCGCGIPNDDMGKGKVSDGGGALTEDDFKVLAEKWDLTIEEVKANTLDLLQKTVKKNK